MSFLIVEGGRFALPKPHMWHSTYRRADLSTSTIISSSPLVSFKDFLVEEIGVEPIPLDFQSNASTELASLPLFVLTLQRYRKYF